MLIVQLAALQMFAVNFDFLTQFGELMIVSGSSSSECLGGVALW